MFKLIVFAVCLVFATADNTDVIVENFSLALRKLDIPEDRMARYQAVLVKARPCIESVTKDADADSIADSVKKLTAVSAGCSEVISILPVNKVKDRQLAFKKCLEEKVLEANSGFDDKQKEVLSKIEICVIDAMKE